MEIHAFTTSKPSKTQDRLQHCFIFESITHCGACNTQTLRTLNIIKNALPVLFALRMQYCCKECILLYYIFLLIRNIRILRLSFEKRSHTHAHTRTFQPIQYRANNMHDVCFVCHSQQWFARRNTEICA